MACCCGAVVVIVQQTETLQRDELRVACVRIPEHEMCNVNMAKHSMQWKDAPLSKLKSNVDGQCCEPTLMLSVTH